MPKIRSIHRCQECGAASPRWAGRCPGCGEWNTLVEERDAPRALEVPLAADETPVLIGAVDGAAASPRPTGIGELDRVLGGGLVPGSVTLVGGEPGIGKSTLLLQALSSMASAGGRALLVSAEESKQQVRMRAERLEAVQPQLWIVSDTALPSILRAATELEPDCIVVDSIQTVFDPELGSAPGTVAQVRECAASLVRAAKVANIAVVLVGHVTKEGSLAGPRLLEHIVDTVLAFEGDRHHNLRMLRAVKHRFGATGELGLFEMTEQGMIGVPDASGMLLGDRRAGEPGAVVVPAIEGRRPLLVELQALVVGNEPPMPRRSAQGVDGGRLSLLVAVLEQRAGVSMGKSDIYASAVGGVRVNEPAADLALALALVSAKLNRPAPADMVACGEVGLGGEIRLVGQTAQRLAEAARLGFTSAVVPASAPAGPPGMTLHRVATLRDAIRTVLPPQ